MHTQVQSTGVQIMSNYRSMLTDSLTVVLTLVWLAIVLECCCVYYIDRQQ